MQKEKKSYTERCFQDELINIKLLYCATNIVFYVCLKCVTNVLDYLCTIKHFEAPLVSKKRIKIDTVYRGVNTGKINGGQTCAKQLEYKFKNSPLKRTVTFLLYEIYNHQPNKGHDFLGYCS